jgi:UDP-N-acetylglucosamine transferase subunit ALG13
MTPDRNALGHRGVPEPAADGYPAHEPAVDRADRDFARGVAVDRAGGLPVAGVAPEGRRGVEREPAAVLVSVGTDKHRFDRLMSWLEEWYASRPDRPETLVQYGRSRQPAIPGAVAFLDHDGLQAAMARARVVVTHGGPASITEARRHGHVPVVVPRNPDLGEHVDNHQQLFSVRMAELGVIRLCTTPDELADALAEGLDGSGVAPGLTLGGSPSPGDISEISPGKERDADERVVGVGDDDVGAAVVRVGEIVDGLLAGDRPRRRLASWRRR